jgi:hypothetical protein
VNSRPRGAFIGMSGFFAGALVASVVSWPPPPRAALVAVAAVLVSTTVWVVSRPRSAPLLQLSTAVKSAPFDGCYRFIGPTSRASNP